MFLLNKIYILYKPSKNAGSARRRCSHKPLRKFSPAFFKRRHGSNAVGRWSSSAEDEIPISFERARKGEQVLGLAGGGNVPLRNLGGVQTKFQTDTPAGSFDYAVGVSPISLAQPPPYTVCGWLFVLCSTVFPPQTIVQKVT